MEEGSSAEGRAACSPGHSRAGLGGTAENGGLGKGQSRKGLWG